MRVYGALMWSLGSILATPEVPRVYMGSFWDEPFRETGMTDLMEREEADLISELAGLPDDDIMTKINEIVRRARHVQCHVHLMAYMRSRVCSKMFGRRDEQAWICTEAGMAHCYDETRRRHQLSRGDFPNWRPLAQRLQDIDFTALYKPSLERSTKLKQLNELMESDVPRLIQQLHALQKRQGRKNEAQAAFRPLRQRRPPPGASTASTSARPAVGAGFEAQRNALASATARLRRATASLQSPHSGVPPPLQHAPSQAHESQQPHQQPHHPGAATLTPPGPTAMPSPEQPQQQQPPHSHGAEGHQQQHLSGEDDHAPSAVASEPQLESAAPPASEPQQSTGWTSRLNAMGNAMGWAAKDSTPVEAQAPSPTMGAPPPNRMSWDPAAQAPPADAPPSEAASSTMDWDSTAMAPHAEPLHGAAPPPLGTERKGGNPGGGQEHERDAGGDGPVE
jgi:hypothetical protein